MNDLHVQEAGAYAAGLLAWWAAREQAFREGRGPLRGAALEGFAGLSRYVPDPAWAWTLPVQRLGDFPAEVQFPATDGAVKWWGAFGQVTPALPGVGPVTLTLYTPLGEERPAQAFLPFRDVTSGQETYGLGRYLDVPLSWAGESVSAQLDFNRAYFPSCAYGEGFSCPLPPQEHWLSVAVRAGERLPE
ncbi:protein of unknown function DUF1684 [Deinococcus proteolyticus MRP]|uniref:DUF1684 domain-containing protein n=1 Tax=Deinococcus proteolyticus (strain ATCC 35074 / DSM 20540 / JCM 6276 / NBRC 101906 / NCIMB 13154 / VKM Ac-1939 / CCM 2703 / MRP) TaxID=693977 RepID=F0RLD8_DEIPM|nr:protein of unknown function DUF1684 [Deinococcus proteolyticus MRP]